MKLFGTMKMKFLEKELAPYQLKTCFTPFYFLFGIFIFSRNSKKTNLYLLFQLGIKTTDVYSS